MHSLTDYTLNSDVCTIIIIRFIPSTVKSKKIYISTVQTILDKCEGVRCYNCSVSRNERPHKCQRVYDNSLLTLSSVDNYYVTELDT